MHISLFLFDIEYWLIGHFEGIALLCNLYLITCPSQVTPCQFSSLKHQTYRSRQLICPPTLPPLLLYSTSAHRSPRSGISLHAPWLRMT